MTSTHWLDGFAVCIGGVPGVGKTALLQAHVQSETRDRQMTGSSIIKSIIAPASVRDLDSWPLERRERVREESINRLRSHKMQCPGRLLIDGHFTLRNRGSGKVEPIFTQEDKAFFNGLVLVQAPPVAVLSQRKADNRDRGAESEDDIAEHIELERNEGRRLADEMAVPFLELLDSDLSLRLRRLNDFLDTISPLGKLR